MKVKNAAYLNFCLRLLTSSQVVGLILIGSLGIVGCGEKNFDPRDYNPASPLPPRVDIMGTPTPDPEALARQKAEEELSDVTPTPTGTVPEAALTVTPTSDEQATEPTATPDPEVSATATPPASPTPTATPQPTPRPPTPTPTTPPTPTATKTAAKSAKSSKESQPTATPQPEVNWESAVIASTIKLDELVVCTNVSNRKPVNGAETFSLAETGRVYTWMRVSGVKPPQMVKHVYLRNGNVVATVKLKLKYASMRTWSRKTFKASQAIGDWKVQVITEQGDVLAEKAFTVVE